MSAPRFFTGTTVTGQVRASTAQTFADVAKALKAAPKLAVSRKVFQSLPKAKRNELKQTPFFVPCTFTESPSKRDYAHAIESNLLFLDIDELPDGTCPAAPFVKDPSLLKKKLNGLKFLAHHTASSTPEKPRMRVMVDADRIPIADYAKAVATLGAMLGLPSITKESAVAVQPMFSPVLFSDSKPGETPIIAEDPDGRPFTREDIQGIEKPLSNGANGSHSAPAEPDELENLAPQDPDITLEIAREALFAIDPDCPRDEWIRHAAALKHQFAPRQNDEALELFDEWSAKGDKYGGEAHTTREWNSLNQTSRGRKPITIRSLLKAAEKGGWERPVAKATPQEEWKVDAYYDSAKKEYLMRNDGGRWLSHGFDAFKRILRSLGISDKRPEGTLLSPADVWMNRIMNKRDVQYAGPLAGRAAGFYQEDGVRFLVTDSPVLRAPKAGQCPTIMNLLRELVGSDPAYGPLQLATLLGWLKMSLESLLAGKRQPGQALALAGPIGCGKSLLQSAITELLGGRSAKANRYMSGMTPFNSELFGAEHLVLEDEMGSTDHRARMNVAAHIKDVTVNDKHSCHAKHREAVNLRPFWRFSISLNDEPEAMLALPPMRSDIEDKIILLQCAMPSTKFPTGSHALRSAYWDTIVSEMPAFAQLLLDHQIPEELADTRFGIRYFHHPELLESLRSLAPETKLMELIDRCLFANQVAPAPWEGTAGELEHLLRHSASDVREEAGKLFSWNTACGVFLGKLANKGRVTCKRNRERRLWVILPPCLIVETFSANVEDY